jgi:hypothetical protein
MVLSELLPNRGVPQQSVPDLACGGWRELALLPGVGESQAKEMVRSRAKLGLPLTADRLVLLPGLGPAGVLEVKAWLRECEMRHSKEPASVDPIE